MRDIPPFGWTGGLGLAAVVVLAAALRLGFLFTCCDGGASASTLIVQGQGTPLDFEPGTQLRGHDLPTEYDNLVHNLREHRWFGGLAPLADREEQTAHVAPGFFYLAAAVGSDANLRRLQALLSIGSVVCLFFFARLAFGSDLVAIAVGTLAALHPFFVVNQAELADGTLIAFLLSAALLLGTLAARTGGPLASVLFGLSLAGLALVRAAFLPFSFLALGWFLLRCRSLRLGWFAGLLALLGFANGLAPWLVRNQSAFQTTLPVADSTYLHLWMGNLPGATGGPIDERALRVSLPPGRVEELLADPNQATRYRRLSHDYVRQLRDDPTGFLARRFAAAQRFLLGDAWFQRQTLVDRGEGLNPPAKIAATVQFVHHAALLMLLIVAAIGWRLSQQWHAECRLATFALIWIPIPYVMSHAESLSGPRLPWDVPLIIFAGYALASLAPSVRRERISAPLLKQVIQEAATQHL